jgi:hypothetical protein
MAGLLGVEATWSEVAPAPRTEAETTAALSQVEDAVQKLLQENPAPLKALATLIE